MHGILLDILPNAIGVALSPLAIIAVIVMLTSKRAKASSLGFLVGWVLTLLAIGTIILASGVGSAIENDGPNRMSLYIQLVLGILLLLFALRSSWPQSNSQQTAAKRAAKIEHMPGYVAFGLALLMVGTSAKNLILTATAMITIAQAGVSDTESLKQLLYFAIIATTAICIPLAIYGLGGSDMTKGLVRFKSWLEKHNANIMTALFLLLGGWVIIKAVVGLKD